MTTKVECTIERLKAREVLDSRGFPTVEVELKVQGIPMVSAIVPSGASTGEHEAIELRDGDAKRFGGKGVLKAVKNVDEKIAPALIGKTFASQKLFDDLLLDLDGTPNKSKLGANAVLAVSMAFARAQALRAEIPLYVQLAESCRAGGDKSSGHLLPVPLMNILNGGKHADNGLNIQEFMIVPVKFDSFSEALRAGAEVFHCLKKLLLKDGLSTGVGDEGGFAPVFHFGKTGGKKSPDKGPHAEALTYLVHAIEEAGYRPGKDIFLALDCAASEFCKSTAEGFVYEFEGEARRATDMVAIYKMWAKQFPLVSIEDGLAENDWDGWKKLTDELGSEIQLVGDDLFVTNPIFLKKGIESKTANSILIKLNQIGTVSETLDAIKMARLAGYRAVTSHRSGESEDSFIADLAVGTSSGQIKTGSACRTDRTSKYNQLLRIEDQLGSKAEYAGVSVFFKDR